MPLQGEFADDYARLREQVRRMQSQIGAANVVELVAETSTDESISVAGGGDSGFLALGAGPQLDVATASGRITVTVSARIRIGLANHGALALMSYELRDAAGVQVVGPDNLRALAGYNGQTTYSLIQGSYTAVHTGLEPGLYTIKTMYRFIDGPPGGTATYSANFINRALIAKGY